MANLFLSLKEKTTDKFWLDVFDSCHNGKFPTGIRYDTKTSVISYRNTSGTKQKIDHIHLKGMSVDVIFTVIMDIFHTKAGLYSPTESSLIIKQAEPTQYEKDWKKIKPKSLKDAMLLDYVISLGFDPQNSKKAFNTLRLGLQFKQILPTDIAFEKTVITKIGSITTKDELLLTRKICLVQKKEKQSPKSRFHQSLEKYAKLSTSLYM